jgi:Flp pilus assembly pilin Flp
MESIIRNYLCARETAHRFRGGKMKPRLSRGQSMTEYALILAAVAIVVYATYETMGTDIGVLAQQIDAKLTAATSG